MAGNDTLSSSLDPVEILGEEFLARRRRGEQPTVEEFVARHPELDAEIRAVFPALALVDDLGGSPAPEAGSPPGDGPRLVGDFRIIREIGRGGMGVVYEAEQVSLGRRVALKLLPERALAIAKHRGRFEREARAAARLHHTNIVPVFGVGEHEGTPYYVMQFIDGRGLDAVVAELRRLAAPKSVPEPRDPTASTIAISLLDDRFGETDSYASTPPDGEGEPGRVVDAGESREGGGPLPARAAPDPGEIPDPDPPTIGSGSAGSGVAYWRAVSRIGVQVAEGLAYAHAHGVVHRDIKPSNLLLDARGAVWIADFGLAKADDSPALTESRDVLGTLRYMPPEAFEGKASRQGDVYSLGLTLHELIALRPAFDETDRARLIMAVTEGRIPELRASGRRVPRDLVTIVRKATERDPDHRYSTATALAEDLRRFAEDRPIAARRVGLVEQLWRWTRRNPLPASLAAAFVAALALGAAGSAYYAIRESRANVELSDSLLRVQRARLSEGEARARTRQALDEMTSGVVDDLMSRQGPTLDPAHRRFLEKSLASYQRFAAESAGSPDARSGAAEAHRRVGTILDRLGRAVDAGDAFRRAVDLGTPLATDFPGEPRYRRDLNRARVELGSALMGMGRDGEAESILREALADQRTLADLSSTGPEDRAGLARIADTLASLLLKINRKDEGMALQQSAVEARRRLVDESPGDVALRRDLATSLNHRALTLREADRLAEAEADHVESLKLRRGIANEPEASPADRLKLGEAVRSWADLLRTQGRIDGAERGLAEALDVLRRLVEDFPAVPSYRESLAATHSSLGILLATRGRAGEAEPHFRDVVLIRRRISADNPAVIQNTASLARSLSDHGSSLFSTGRSVEAERAFRESVVLYRRLAREAPEIQVYRRSLTTSLYNLGLVLGQRLGRRGDAEVIFREAVQIGRGLVAKAPEVASIRVTLARNLNLLSGMERRHGRNDAAVANSRESVATWDRLAANAPKVTSYPESAAESRRHLALTLISIGRKSEAETVLLESTSLMDRLLADDPANTHFGYEVAEALTILADLLVDLGRAAEARGALARAGHLLEIALTANPDDLTYRIAMREHRWISAVCLAAEGRWDEAAEAARAVALLGWDKAEDGFASAMALDRSAVLLAKDGRVPSKEREARSRALADEAFDRLRQAVADGLADPGRIAEDGLDSLRDRPEYQLMLLDVTMPADPFAHEG